MAVKGVIVAAGYGSRFLPITKVVPKELLPIVDRPPLDYLKTVVDLALEHPEVGEAFTAWLRDRVGGSALQ